MKYKVTFYKVKKNWFLEPQWELCSQLKLCLSPFSQVDISICVILFSFYVYFASIFTIFVFLRKIDKERLDISVFGIKRFIDAWISKDKLINFLKNWEKAFQSIIMVKSDIQSDTYFTSFLANVESFQLYSQNQDPNIHIYHSIWMLWG